MAHELEAESGSEKTVASDEGSDGKLLLNRRKYVMTGGAAIAALVMGGSRTEAATRTSDVGSTYWTDFSEKSL